MADETSVGASSSGQTSGSSESTIEINIKTLDSQIHTFRVEKDMLVSVLKEKIVNVTGVPVEQQRLIFRGKVLKDDHLLSSYHLEDGHTLHLVVRQPVQGQPAPDTGSGLASRGNQGNQSAGTQSRIGQVSHSVVLGTVNVAEPGEGMIPDIGQIVGAVLNSLGVGNLASSGGTNNASSANSNPASTSVETEGTHNSASGAQRGNPVPPGFSVVNQPFLPPQVLQFHRLTAIPDSLTTLLEFISRMELALQYDGSQSAPTTNGRDNIRPDIPSQNSGRLPTPEMLGSVMERVRQLLVGNAASALSHTAGRLGREGTSTDPSTRSQIQSEAMHLGIAMQHLGAMFLELGRTIMTLRMGQSPAEAFVNAGPAVYISSAGPNPIMVQPSPLQTSSLFSVPPPSVFGGSPPPSGAGDSARNINIHIHAGTSAAPGVTTTGTRSHSGDGIRGERRNAEQSRSNVNGSGDSLPTRGLPSRTVMAAIPTRSTTETGNRVLSVIYPVHLRSQQSGPVHSTSTQASHPTASSGSQSSMPPISQSSAESESASGLLAQLNAHIATLAGNTHGHSSTGNMQTTIDASPLTISSIAMPGIGNSISQIPTEPINTATLVTQTGAQLANELSDNVQPQSSYLSESTVPRGLEKASPGGSTDDVNSQADSLPETETGRGSDQQSAPEGDHLGGVDSREQNVIEESSNPNPASGSAVCQHNNNHSSESVIEPSRNDSVSSERLLQSSQHSDRSAPLGLGLGGLQPKKRAKSAKITGKNDMFPGSSSSTQNKKSVAMGQQVLRSLVSQRPDRESTNANGSSGPLPPGVSQILNTIPFGGQGAIGPVGNALQTSDLNSMFTGVAEQCTRNPAVMNTLNQIVRQVGQSEDIGGMLSGAGRGNGGIDFSRMFQQMMPVFSEALGMGSMPLTSTPSLQSEQIHDVISGGSGIIDNKNSQINVQHVAERIERHDSPREIFHAVLESASRLLDEGNSYGDLVDELGDSAELSSEFLNMLQSHIRRRLQTESAPEEKP